MQIHTLQSSSILSVSLILILVSVGHARAAVDIFSDSTVELGVSTWLSDATTRWSHDASSANPGLGNPTSELEYEDLWSAVAQVDGMILLRKGMFGRARVGYGAITDGTLTDDDFAAGPVLSSRTVSDVDDDRLWYVSADLGVRFLAFPGNRGYLGAFVGYQHWRERVTARGIIQVVPPGAPTNVGQPVITNQAQWDSLRVGLETLLRLTRRLRVEGNLAAIPFTALENEDVHHLRTDLRKDPSFSMRGTGFGVNAEAALSHQLSRAMTVSIGYRMWWLRVEDGEWTTHPIGDSPGTFPLREFHILRHGATVGISYAF